MIESGKTVKVHYKGTLDDGSVFDSSEGKNPLEFRVGCGQVIPGFDAAVVQMEIGETKTIKIPCAEAYGESKKEAIITIPHEQIPGDVKPEVGYQLQIKTSQGTFPARVVEVSEKGATIDANHPLAGKDLTFELTLVEVAG
jgi:peptidylprolyl isomerase